MKNTINDVIKILESWSNPAYQESYDNAGLIVGNANQELLGGLICLDLTPKVFQEALEKKANLIISHHPLIFNPIKKLNGKNNAEKIIMEAIKHDICIYAMHTNLDNIFSGVNHAFASALQLQHTAILSPKDQQLKKLVTFAPTRYAETIRQALFEVGGGNIGNYNSCSFNQMGFGTFKAEANAQPFVGQIGELHHEEEMKIEMVFPAVLQNTMIQTLQKVHPYEEVAFDIINLANTNPYIGAGMIGDLQTSMDLEQFIRFLKQQLSLSVVKCSNCQSKKIKKVAICGGSGSFLIPAAMNRHADIFISSEFKHNHFIDTQNQLILVDIGHYESEIATKKLIFAKLIEKFSNFAVSVLEENPVKYF
ncbi:MAG: Nif3-like dinuclear metal center hexameric protein [Bacteroidales bacterium]|nr:Nif3-like dinuclear metal center hexameric protein [Bacteroidales bacterium]